MTADVATLDTTRPMTILFVDVAGSTRLYETLGDDEALRRVRACLDVATEATTEHGGTVVKNIGDELLCTFPDSGSALLAACAMQSLVRALPETGGIRNMFRIGFQHGPVLMRDGDAFGDTVNVAARIVALAAAGQILVGSDACDTLPSHLKFGIRPLGQATIRGRSAEVRLHEIVWDMAADLTQVADGATLRALPKALSIELQFGTLTWRIERGAIAIGRDPGNEVVLSTKRASRSHARIEARDGRFVLRDSSTNGTFVQPAEGDGRQICRDETELTGSGCIYFGHKPTDEGVEGMTFAIG